MSTIAVDKIKPSAGGTEFTTRGVSKAWVNFNGTGVVAIRDSENVSSVTDNGTGDYTVNIANNMSDANYSSALNGIADSGGFTGQANVQPKADVAHSSSLERLVTSNSTSATLVDYTHVYCSVLGDLA